MSTCHRAPVKSPHSRNGCRIYVKLKSIPQSVAIRRFVPRVTREFAGKNKRDKPIRRIRRANSTLGNLRREVGGTLDRLPRAGRRLARITLDCDNANKI